MSKYDFTGASVRVLFASGVILVALMSTGCKPDRHVSADTAAPKVNRPNIILITIESLRAGHIGCYGYERDTSPHLDALADEGILFEDAQSVTSWTLTSHASIFTGLYPSAHKVINPKDRLADGYKTLADNLKACGYQTAGIVSGVYLDPKHNLNKGFEYYDTYPIRAPGTPASKDITNGRMEESTEKFFHQVRDKNRPFFLFAYYWDPHHHYIPPPPYDTMFVPPGAKKPERVEYSPSWKLGRNITPAEVLYEISQYDGEIRCTDETIGRLFALLKEEGLWDNTAIIVTADHGEEFYDHGHNSHKNSLYVETIHVPLIFKPVGSTEPKRDKRVVSLVDLFPTVMEIAGCRIDQPINGQSLLQPPPTGDRAIFHELKSIWYFTRKSTGESWSDVELWTAVRKGDYKLIHVVDPDGKKPPRWEMYNVVDDPAEKKPLTRKYEEIAGELQGEMERWSTDMKSLADLWEGGPEAQLTPEEEQRLHSLGYLP